jgi:hypothetical protein
MRGDVKSNAMVARGRHEGSKERGRGQRRASGKTKMLHISTLSYVAYIAYIACTANKHGYVGLHSHCRAKIVTLCSQ